MIKRRLMRACSVALVSSMCFTAVPMAAKAETAEENVDYTYYDDLDDEETNYVDENENEDGETVEEDDEEILEIHFVDSKMSLTMDKTKEIKFTTNLKEEVGGSEFLWSSSNDDVAEVNDEGHVTGLAPGVTTITAKNENGASASLKVTVSPNGTSFQKVIGKKKQLGLKWKKLPEKANIKGYQIEYATSKKFSGSKKVLVKDRKTSSKTIKNLKNGKTYYVRIRTYQQVGKVRYYSSWSKVKSAKIKKS